MVNLSQRDPVDSPLRGRAFFRRKGSDSYGRTVVVNVATILFLTITLFSSSTADTLKKEKLPERGAIRRGSYIQVEPLPLPLAREIMVCRMGMVWTANTYREILNRCTGAA